MLTKADAHEHFCAQCYPHISTNGKMGRGWWRCLSRKCTRGVSSPCRLHDGSHKRDLATLHGGR